MANLMEYAEQVGSHALFICCNDCYCMNGLIAHPGCLVATAFGSNVSIRSGFDGGYFRPLIVNEGVRQVVIVGHLNCRLMHNSCRPVDVPGRRFAGRFLSVQEMMDPARQVEHHIATTVESLRRAPFFQRLSRQYGVTVRGVVVDDRHHQQVWEVDQFKAVHLPFHLN